MQGMLVGAMLTAPWYRDVKEQFFGSAGTIETARWYWKHIRGKRDEVLEEEGHDVTIDALQEFVSRVQSGKPENTGVRSAESTLTAILGQLAIEKRREVAWDEMMAG